MLVIVAMVFSLGVNGCSLSWSGIGHSLDLHPEWLSSSNAGRFAYDMNVYIRILYVKFFFYLKSTHNFYYFLRMYVFAE